MHGTNGYLIISLDHHHFSLKELGNLVPENIDDDQWSSRLKELKIHFNLDELYFLRTCNRLCFFIYSKSRITDQSSYHIVNYWLQRELTSVEISKINLNRNLSAIRHLFDLASSIESMIVGEREILRQIKSAYSFSKKQGLSGDHVRLAISACIQVAKQVYIATKIAERPVSIVSIAMRKLNEYNIPSQPKYLLIGAGHTINLVAKFLKQRPFSSVDIYNRTKSKADSIADSLRGEAHKLCDLVYHRKDFDVMIICTGNRKSIVTPEIFNQLVQKNSRKIIIDLSVPHNVDPLVQNQAGVEYIAIEQLRDLAKTNLSVRKKEMSKANLIIDRHMEQFRYTHINRQIELKFSQIPYSVAIIKDQALNEIFQERMTMIDHSSRRLIIDMMDYMEKKCVAAPYIAAKKVMLF